MVVDSVSIEDPVIWISRTFNNTPRHTTMVWVMCGETDSLKATNGEKNELILAQTIGP